LKTAGSLLVAGTLTVTNKNPELDIDGTASVLRIFASTDGAYIQAGANHTLGSAKPLFFSDMNSAHTWMTIGATGNVGIGTNTPAAKPEVNGDLKVSGVTGTVTANNVAASGAVSAQTVTAVGTATAGTLNVTGTATAGSFIGNGAALAHLNASAITSGNLDSARMPANFTGDRTFSGGTVEVTSNVRMFHRQPQQGSTWKPTRDKESYDFGPVSTDGFLNVRVGPPDGRINDNYVCYVDALLLDESIPLAGAGVSSVSGTEWGSKVNSLMVPVPKGKTCRLTYPRELECGAHLPGAILRGDSDPIHWQQAPGCRR
jgi:hypothetical protein